MTTEITLPPAPAAPGPMPARRSLRALAAWQRMLVYGLGFLALLSFVRVVTGADQLTSTGTVQAAVIAAIPIGLAGLAGLWSERAGVVNIGLEGMMILGTFGAGWIGWQYGPWVGVVAAVLFGVLGGLVHAVATVTFGVDHIVSGVAINILGLGVTQYLAATFLTGTPGGGAKQSPPIDPIGTVSLPWVGDALQGLEDKEWFFVSDLAGVIRGITIDVSYLTIVSVLLLFVTFYVLWRTPFGLRLRSCGEAPYAAESLGVNVYRYKYFAVLISGGLAGMGGAYLATVAASNYRDGQTAGRGFIGLAAMIFGNWRPGGLAAGAGLFGYTDGLQLRDNAAVHALLLLAAVLCLIGLVVLLVRRRWLSAVITAAAGALMLVWYLGTDTLPQQVVGATPYVTTLVVLGLASQRLRMPKADGLPYRRGEGH
jgi:simple sugar transport system permease protein